MILFSARPVHSQIQIYKRADIMCLRYRKKRLDCTQSAVLEWERGEDSVEYKTLKQVCAETEVSRRAIQGYEKAGLVFAAARNERGYLLYDRKAVERIRLIRLLQKLDFSIKEIVQVIDAPKEIFKEALEEHVAYLEGKREEMDELIERAYQMIEEL